MSTFRVNVNKLNLRTGPVTNFDNKGNVIAVLQKGAIFESVGMLENELGRWHIGKDGSTVSDNFVAPINDDIPPELVKYHDKIPKIFLDFHLGKLWELPMQEGLKVGIIDNGVEINHAALKGRVTNLNDEICISKEDNPNHATTMACIIAGNDPENGIIGVAPRVKSIYSYTLPREELRPKMFVEALKAMENEKVNIINISYGSNNPVFQNEKDELQEIITRLCINGCIIISSSGNDYGKKKDYYPACYDNVISVTGITSNLTRTKSANFWNGVTLCMCTDFYFDEHDFKHSHATSGATAIITGSLALAYQTLTGHPDPKIYLKNVLSLLNKVSFNYKQLQVEIPQFDGETFCKLLNKTT